MKAHARSALLHHRHLRAVRLRQLQLHRHSDRRHRGAGAHPQVGPGAAGPEGRGRRHDGEFHVGLHRGDAAVMRRIADAATIWKPHRACGRASAWCSAAAWAASPANWRTASKSRTPRSPAGPAPPPSGTPASWWSARSAALPVAVMAGRAHLYEGYTPAAGDLRRARAGRARRAVDGLHQRRRRHQPGTPARRAGADLRPHQPAGLESAGRPERRLARARASPT